MPHMLGLKPYRPGSIKFRMSNYLAFDNIVVPAVFGHVVDDAGWGVLANTDCGCCVVSGSMHETMNWTRAASGKAAPFNDDVAKRVYMQVSGWNGKPDDPSDSGLDMDEFAKYRRNVGIPDATGAIHKVLGYGLINSVDHIVKAAYALGACGLGINFPDSAMSQFENQRPWTPVAGARNDGGHYIPIVGRNSQGMLICITWGRLQAMSVAFAQQYMMAAVAYVSAEYVEASGETPEHLNLTAMNSDLTELANA